MRMNLLNGADRDDMDGFVAVSSPFYPELAAWYEAYLGRWLPGWRRR